MPYGPKGQWRPAETGPCAVHVMKIATGEIEETFEPPERKEADRDAAARRAAKAGKARAASQTPEERRDQARAAAAARWGDR